MIKYFRTAVVFEEVPDEVTLAIEITNCPGHCEGCHSPWLREDIGEELTPDILEELIKKNDGITCLCFMGEGNDREGLFELVNHLIAYHPELKRAIYTGTDDFESFINVFDYVKYGPYKVEFGPLNKETTNQHLLKVDLRTCKYEDITYKFWKRQ